MKRTTRATFSVDPPTVDVKLPGSWAELSQTELRAVYEAMCKYGGRGIGAVWFAIFRRLARVRVMRSDPKGVWCRFVCTGHGRKYRTVCRVTAEQLAELLEPLSFVSSPGDMPVRLDRWHGAVAVDARLIGVDFGTYLQIENRYQGYIADPTNEETFAGLATLLYPGVKPRHFNEVFVLNVLQWVVQIKTMFSRQWPNFFKPAGGGVDAPPMLEVMNNEIRALTGGDVTKEDVIFATPCWRALTELDYKAKDADEMKKQFAKHT